MRNRVQMRKVAALAPRNGSILQQAQRDKDRWERRRDAEIQKSQTKKK